MPYLNKRNRFVQAAKQFADNAAAAGGGKSPDYSAFTKTELLAIAQSIGMKGIPTWVLKDFKSAVSKGVYDLTSILANQTTPV
jgi:hypothetical protein